MPRPGAYFDALVGGIRVNTLSEELRGGRRFLVKERRPFARPVLVIANLFFEAVQARLHAISDVAVWQDWEIGSFNRLHGERFRAFAIGGAAVAAEKLPGVNLTEMLDHGTIATNMAAAVGRELRRAHRCHTPEYAGPWSHGDPHLGNFVYDPAEDCARLIDFEVMHDQEFPAAERHIDDVRVVLQDILGRATAERWLPSSLAFLQGYDCSDIAVAAVQQLNAPPGLGRIWWLVRTSWIGTMEANRRITELRAQM